MTLGHARAGSRGGGWTNAGVAVVMIATLALFGVPVRAEPEGAAVKVRNLDAETLSKLKFTGFETSYWGKLTEKQRNALATQTIQVYADLSADAAESRTYLAANVGPNGQIVPIEFEPALYQDIASKPGLASFAVGKKAIDARIVLATRRQDRSAVSDAGFQEAITALDKTAWEMFAMAATDRRELEGKVARSEIPAEAASEVEKGLKATFAYVRELLAKAQTAEEAHADAQKVVPIELLTQISGNARITAAIFYIDINNVRNFKGSGFIYKGHAVSAAHVLSESQFWTAAPQHTLDVSRVRVALLRPDGTFGIHPDELLSVESKPGGQLYVPEHDVCCLRPMTPAKDSPAEKLLAAASARAQDTSVCVFDDVVGHLEIGLIYSMGALANKAEDIPQAYWSAFGRIVYPDVVIRPDLDPITNVRRDPSPGFLRAIRNEVFSNWTTACREPDVDAAIGRVFMAYDPGELDVCGLRVRLDGSSKLPDLSADANFKSKRLLRCFGTDMPSQGGLSGAPVFLFGAGAQRVVGIHQGYVGGYEDAEPRFTSLTYFRRATPFYLVRGEIDAFISKP